MLSSINPLGEWARNNRWSMTASWYIVGSLVGGALIGAAVGTVSWIAGAGRMSTTQSAGVVIGVTLVALLADLLWPRRIPGPRRQVDERWLDVYRAWVYGGGFGIQLGTGVVTIVATWTVYAVWVFALMTGSPAHGALLGAVFGLARALPILAARRAHDGPSLRLLFGRLHRLETAATSLSLAVEAAVVLAATGLLWRAG
jgi:Cytochrome C biogenesis protein transmembrane region